MLRVRALAAFAVALMLVGAGADRAEAQSPISSDAMEASRAAAGTAKVLGARIVAGDSLIVSIEDALLTGEAIGAGRWLLGGREETPRAVGRSIAEAVRLGLPAGSPVKIIVVDVVGAAPAPTRVRLPYRMTDLAPR